MTYWSREDARAFVSALFEHVSRSDKPRPEWLEAWTNRAMRLGSAERTFYEFINTPAHHKHIQDERDARPRWPIGHFYSPITSRRELERDSGRIFRRMGLPGVDLRVDAQLAMLHALAAFFSSVPFPENITLPQRYYYNNTSYGFGDALIYWSMINHLRPQRILEIGSGFTSALALDTIERLNLETTCTFVDPYPELAHRTIGVLPAPHQIIASRIQDLDLSTVNNLEAGDLLFIDSTHVLKTGSDVHFELTQVLPRVKTGVFIHFHDVFSGFEYPKNWSINGNYSWNEIYALHIFLEYNSAFQIEFFNHYIAAEHADKIQKLGMPEANRFLLNPGGGLWLSRC